MEKRRPKQQLQRPIFVSKWFPYAPAFAVTLGILRLIVFYNAFNVRVIPFLEFSEVIISFMDILLVLLFSALYNIIMSKLESKQEVEETLKKFKGINGESSEWRKLIKYFKFYLPYLGAVGAGLLIILIYSFFVPVPAYVFGYVATFAVGMVVFGIIRIQIHHQLDEFDSSQDHRDFMHLTINGFLYLVLVFGAASLEAKILKESPDHPLVVVVLNDSSVIKTNNSYYFIGKTQNYLFFYSAEPEKTDVIPSSEIKSITFHKPPQPKTWLQYF